MCDILCKMGLGITAGFVTLAMAVVWYNLVCQQKPPEEPLPTASYTIIDAPVIVCVGVQLSESNAALKEYPPHRCETDNDKR